MERNPRGGCSLSIAGLAAFWREFPVNFTVALRLRFPARKALANDLWLISRNPLPEHKMPTNTARVFSLQPVAPPYGPFCAPSQRLFAIPLDGQFSALRRLDRSTVPSTSTTGERDRRTARRARSEGS